MSLLDMFYSVYSAMYDIECVLLFEGVILFLSLL